MKDQDLRVVEEPDALPPPVNPVMRKVMHEGRRHRRRQRHRMGFLRRVWRPDVLYRVTVAFAVVSMAFGFFGGWRHLPLLLYSAIFSLVMIGVSEKQWFAHVSSRRGGDERRDHFTPSQTGIVVVLMTICGFWYFYRRGVWLLPYFN